MDSTGGWCRRRDDDGGSTTLDNGSLALRGCCRDAMTPSNTFQQPMAGASQVFRPFVMVLGRCCCSAEGTAAAALVQGPRSRWSARHRGAGRGGLGVRGACVDMIKVYCEHYRELCDEDINMDGSGPGIDCPESKSVVMLCRCDLDSSFPVLLQRSPAEPRWIPRARGGL